MDAPLSEGMTRDGMVAMLVDERGWNPGKAEGAVAAAERHGSSLLRRDVDQFLSLRDVVACNRAGPGESEVDPETLIRDLFVVRRARP